MVTAMAVALFTALAGAAAAERLATNQFSAAPTENRAIAMAEVAMAQRPHNIPGPAIPCGPTGCPDRWDPSGDQVRVFDDFPDRNEGFDHATVAFWLPPNQVTHVVDEARSRLIADGWTIVEVAGRDHLVADKGNLSVGIYRSHGSGATATKPAPSVYLYVDQKTPTLPSGIAALAGFLAGLVAGWMAMVWLLHRHRRHSTGLRAATILVGVPPLIMIVLVEAITLKTLLFDAASMPLSLLPTTVMAVLVGLATTTISTAFVAVEALATIVLAVLPTRVHSPVTARHASTVDDSDGTESSSRFAPAGVRKEGANL